MLDTMINSVQTVREKILQRRRQMVVHSYIYYWLDDSIVTDHQWQAWAEELRALQELFGWEGVGYFDSVFKDWDGSTGCDLPKGPETISKARQLLRLRDQGLVAH